MDGASSPFRAPVVALDGPGKVTGAARYTFDLSLPGILHAKVLRSPHPHAHIRSIDTGRAEALPGVAAVVTGADAARLPDPYYGVAIRDQPVVAIDKVRYVGDMVAAVDTLLDQRVLDSEFPRCAEKGVGFVGKYREFLRLLGQACQ